MKICRHFSNLLFISILTLFSFNLQAQSAFTISGQVHFSAIGFPIDEIPIFVASADGQYVADVFTDADGYYSISFDIPAGDIIEFEVATFDPCTGEFLIVPTSNENGDVIIDFEICIDFVLPDCQASFWYEMEGNDLNVQFIDESYANNDLEITSWAWDFGDGNTSTEQNPFHTYAESGQYIVTLTIVAGDCVNTVSQDVWVGDDPWNCGCDAVWEPVCVITDFGNFTFSNACEAECFGFMEYTPGECEFEPPVGCDCGCDIFPVCVTLDDGTVLTFPNECLAYCQGYSHEDFFFCEGQEFCDCDIYEIDPVCVVGADGDIITIPSVCWATCMGFGDDQIVECENPCECDDIYDPVCVYSAAGVQLFFENACQAECAGFGPDQYVECEDDPCADCSDVWDPVCVNLFGFTITFENECIAICEGFGPDDFVDCEVDPCNCTEEYDPVCVVDPATNEQIMFPNACFAECAGFGPDQFVECENVEPCVCIEIYDPVCVIDPQTGEIITFPNACFAECEGFGPDQFFECDGVEPCDDCPEFYEPVCVLTLSGEVITFPNACFAECAGYGPDHYFECDGIGPCDDCPEVYEPVCVFVNTIGDVITFPNACFAECAGYGPDQYFECDGGEPCPDCSGEYDPVCVNILGAPLPLVFQNACHAICHGFDESQFNECDDVDPCNCTEEYDPVCVWDPSIGHPIEFPNACHAICAGYEEGDFVDCDTNPCGCSFEYDPVCVISAAGNIERFNNVCLAECAGFGPDDFVECEDDILPCGCELILDPVCIAGDNGSLTIYPNACFAECDGLTPDQYGACELPPIIDPIFGCECDLTIDPVCVEVEENLVIPFLNICWVECSGFSLDDIVNCDDHFDENSIGGQMVMGYQSNSVTSTGQLNFVESLSAFPNPVSDKLNLDITLADNKEVMLNIVNIAGAQVSTQQLELQKGNQIIEINATDYAPGIYMINLQTDKQVQTIRFVKQ